tara:strand:- start:25301 stop:26392 length:1092 start_codon:yes stop_codon:yes gene_type:complete
MFVDLIAGARPNFIKIASIVSAFDKNDHNKINYRLIHTGQHYDNQMSSSFFKQLEIPSPDINLGVGSGSQADQAGRIMYEYEKVILTDGAADLCIVVGDVNSTMACAITSKKMNVKVAHIEAGIRSGDLTMPEEINRIVTDSISDYFFTTSEYANKNLLEMGVSAKKIYFVGNTMIDTLLKNKNNFIKPSFWEEYNLINNRYFVLTMHRPSNVDDLNNFKNILKMIAYSLNDLTVIFPVHPRTLKILKNIKNIPKNLICVEPQTYLEFNYLVKNSLGVITDSGGITEEATVFGVPCLTMRDSTERPETIEVGTNYLVGSNPDNIDEPIKMIISNAWKKGSIPKKWDGMTGKRIAKHINEILKN